MLLISKDIKDLTKEDLTELKKIIEDLEDNLDDNLDEQQEETAENKMPKKLKKDFTVRVAKLIEGKTFTAKIKGILCDAQVKWEYSKEGSIYCKGYRLPAKSSSLTKTLFNLVEAYCSGELWQEILEPKLYETKAYLDFEKEIKKICDESDKYEATYDDYCWDEILEQAENIR